MKTSIHVLLVAAMLIGCKHGTRGMQVLIEIPPVSEGDIASSSPYSPKDRLRDMFKVTDLLDADGQSRLWNLISSGLTVDAEGGYISVWRDNPEDDLVWLKYENLICMKRQGEARCIAVHETFLLVDSELHVHAVERRESRITPSGHIETGERAPCMDEDQLGWQGSCAILAEDVLLRYATSCLRIGYRL